MSSLHRGDANGFGGVDEALAATGQTKATAASIFTDWTLAVALDGLVDDGHNILGSLKETQRSDTDAPLDPPVELVAGVLDAGCAVERLRLRAASERSRCAAHGRSDQLAVVPGGDDTAHHAARMDVGRESARPARRSGALLRNG